MDAEEVAFATAIFTGVAGIITACASIISAKKQGNDLCQERLKNARLESESLAELVHELKMKQYDVKTLPKDSQ